mgnify:FL=1
MFSAAADVWRAARGVGGGLFLKCWWAYWKCVRQERNAGRGWESVCMCVCVSMMYGESAAVASRAPCVLMCRVCVWTCL